MALEWDVRKCDQSHCFDPDTKEMTSTCKSLIYATVIVGISEITESNYKEFACRLEYDRRLYGCFSFSEGSAIPALVKPFIGMRTNATKLTRAQFEKKISKMFREQYFKEVSDEKTEN